MGVDEQIRVSETVERTIERRRREGERYNDVLERLLVEEDAGDFDAGFGRWSDDEADRALTHPETRRVVDVEVY